MIPVSTQQKEIDNLPGEEIEFTIGDPRWVMRSTADLYSNRELACIREYSTNARDSMIESGQAGIPIRVVLPTLMHPYFEVEDFGVGMSPEDIKTTYTQFGTSTKRGSNDYNGMLGFGSKAAIAYTNTFTVTAVKDGIQTVAVITRKPDYAVVLKVVQTSKTMKPNGVKVTIPVSNHEAFSAIARDFYRFWPTGTVKVDGEFPEWAVGDKLDDNLYYSKKPGTSYVVMGNVGYRINNPDALFRNKGMKTISFVAYVANGAVEFTPSREDLKYSDHTKKTLHDIIANFEAKMIAEARRDIAGASGFFDAYTRWSYWVSKLGKGPFGDLEFNGEKLVDDYPIRGYRFKPSETRYNTYAVDSWAVSAMHETLIITGCSTSGPSSHHKGRVRDFISQYDKTVKFVIFTPAEKVESVWVDPKRVVTWEFVKEETKKVRANNGYSRPKRIKGTFDFATKNGWEREKPIPDDKNIYYIQVAVEKSVDVSPVLRYFDDDSIVVLLAANRIAKFTRDNPQVKEFVSAFRDKVELDGVKFLDAKTKAALAVGGNTREWLRYLDLTKVDDPDWSVVAKLLSEYTNDSLAAYNKAYNLARYMRMHNQFKKHDIQQTDNFLIQRYPLLAKLSKYDFKYISDEVYFYMNAKYRTMKGN